MTGGRSCSARHALDMSVQAQKHSCEPGGLCASLGSRQCWLCLAAGKLLAHGLQRVGALGPRLLHPRYLSSLACEGRVLLRGAESGVLACSLLEPEDLPCTKRGPVSPVGRATRSQSSDVTPARVAD